MSSEIVHLTENYFWWTFSCALSWLCTPEYLINILVCRFLRLLLLTKPGKRRIPAFLINLICWVNCVFKPSTKVVIRFISQEYVKPGEWSFCPVTYLRQGEIRTSLLEIPGKEENRVNSSFNGGQRLVEQSASNSERYRELWDTVQLQLIVFQTRLYLQQLLNLTPN